MTSGDEANPSAVAMVPAATSDTTANEEQPSSSTSSSSSTPKGFIAALTGAAKHLATSISIRGPASADASMSQSTDNDDDIDDDNAMIVEELDVLPSQSEIFPSPSQGSGVDGMDVSEDPAIGLDTVMAETSTSTTTTLSLETNNPPLVEGNSPKYVVDNGEEILVWEDGIEDTHAGVKQVESMTCSVDKVDEARLGEELENSLQSLQKRMTKAISAHKYDNDDKSDGKGAYGKLRNAATKAYNSLVNYGSSMDLSSQIGNDDDAFLEEGRRSRLLQFGRNLWMDIRNYPELFHDTLSPEDSVRFEGRKDRAVASGYVRAIAARLVFLNYIDTRCSIGVPPELRKSFTGRGGTNKSPSFQELEFGLKLFSRAGRVILEHNRQDVRPSYDLLSLAASCFEAVSAMAQKGSGEAATRLKDLFDEAFDAISMLPTAASLFGETRNDQANDLKDTTWQLLVIKSLTRAESFVDKHCNVSTTSSLRCFLPALAKLCYKHGSHFVKLREYDNAGKALHITLKSTNSCLTQIRQELKQVQSQKSKVKQMLHNLEAELVVVSIEAFYLLNVTYQSSGDKDKALVCLDRIEEYMKEQHARDLELHSNVMSTLSSGDDFIFAEGSGNSALEGSRNHFEKDKADIKNRVQTAIEDARSRHAAEKATLVFSRIMTYHKALPSPSLDEESVIDQKIRDLVELSLDITQNQFTSGGSKVKGNNEVFNLALHAIRLVHVRRIISKVSGSSDGAGPSADTYKYLFDKLPKSHFRRPFVLVDKLNAMLAIEYQVRERKFDTKAIKQLDTEALATAKELLETIKFFLEKSTSKNRDNETTLFATSTHQPLSNELFEQSKIHFARAVSLYHASDAHAMCAQWSDLLQKVLQMEYKSMLATDSGLLLGQVMTVKAYALSMSGNLDSGRQTARDAWEKTKTIDSMVTLFHCSLRHEVNNHSGDTMLEFDAALSELLSPASGSATDDIIAAFPRLSNSCAENEGSDLILLGVQERWIDLILNSKPFRCLKESDDVDDPEFTLFDIVRAYLSNFEHVISVNKDLNATVTSFQALERIIDGVLKLLVQLRETRQQKKSSARRKKRKSVANTDSAEIDGKAFTLVWDDHTVNKLVGDRSDCVWIVEQLWNIGNQLMSVSFAASGVGDLRGVAANVFAASHDFCLMSDEEVGQSLSKGFLDFDIKFDPTKSVLPSFGQTTERLSCDISSEFSAQCLLVSVATAVDYASDCLMKSKNGSNALEDDVQILLGRSLHRLAQAQDEMQLNCEDEKQRSEVNKMIVLLALRCLLGVGEDSLAVETLKGNGLYAALDRIHLDELSVTSTEHDIASPTNTFVSLRNVKLMADLAEEQGMHQTSRCLQRLCAHQLSQSGKFVLDLGDYEISLGEIQRKTIQSSTSAKVALDVYDEVDELVKKHQNESKKRKEGSFYSVSELTWFAKDANNRAVEHDLLGDNQTAARLYATALNLLPLCGKEMQCHAQAMNAAYQQIISRMNARGDSFSVWNLAGE